jgi:hypothetical protein
VTHFVRIATRPSAAPALGHGRLRHHREHRQQQWVRERRNCSTLPHGIRSMPVTTGVATSARDQPQKRAHRTMASTASHGPLPPAEDTTGATQFLPVARSRSGINTLIRVRCSPSQGRRCPAPLPRVHDAFALRSRALHAGAAYCAKAAIHSSRIRHTSSKLRPLTLSALLLTQVCMYWRCSVTL